ncbi:glycosyltransferase family 2 protein [Cellulomonas sp. PhB143]|uniref:glycosyltransferase family 2 protein n=1 Tax=Cellulomonas sp. PhB143 TaxID=2485186 RepID=UPI000FBA58BC|nr:glycosyltransferase family 2 protein [Cellulomonas sp. PhB143]ROS76626.1 glycosyl transferase family 2 [Cellulomonas sp. PhB143]
MTPERSAGGGSVSVLCPTYNGTSTLAATIESVLAQSHGDLELLVGDDGSTDGTGELVEGYARSDRRVRLVRLEHTGDPGTVRRALMRRSGGRAIAYVDHDDVWRPAHLEVALRSLVDTSTVVVAGADYHRPGDAEPAMSRSGEIWNPEIATIDPFAEPTRVVHLRALVGPRTNWRAARGGLEDWDLWWRLASQRARFRPLRTITTSIRLAPGTRRGSLRHRVALPLARMPSSEAAAELAREARSGAEESFAEDLGRWGDELEGCGRATPARVPMTGGSGPVPSWLVPCAVPGGTAGWIVGFAAPFVDRRHGAAIGDVVRRRFGTVVRRATELACRTPGAEPVGRIGERQE